MNEKESNGQDSLVMWVVVYLAFALMQLLSLLVMGLFIFRHRLGAETGQAQLVFLLLGLIAFACLSLLIRKCYREFRKVLVSDVARQNAASVLFTLSLLDLGWPKWLISAIVLGTNYFFAAAWVAMLIAGLWTDGESQDLFSLIVMLQFLFPMIVLGHLLLRHGKRRFGR